ncbi:MAG TPA: POTRA domain-containing protein [Xanthobacteraceae bacterium]|nr:POTRA domain-containing protein [Xanthobacteraceae bacterium]
MLPATAPFPAAAQQAARSPQPNLGRTERYFDVIEREQTRAKKPAPLPSASGASVAADTRPLFRLAGVTVAGATALSGDAIAQTYRAYLGKTVSQADLAAIAGRISDLYRAAGYHLSRAIVPPQDIRGGRIRIQVIEGRIVDVALEGERIAQFGLRAMLAPVTEESPSRRATLERALLLVNDLPGVRIADTALEEIGTGSGRFRLTVSVETWQNYTAIGIDNRGTDAIGPWQSYFASTFNSAFVPGDSIGVNLSTIPTAPIELGFGRLFYNAPVGDDGARIGVVGSYGEQRPGDERAAIDTVDRSGTFDLRGSIVPLRSREQTLWLSAAAGIGEFYEDTVFGPSYRDHIRAVYATADYQLHDWLNGWNYWTVTARQGLPIFGASDKDDPLLSRSDGSATFSKLAVFYTRYQPLSDIWSLKLSFAGQLVSTALLASEEFYLGGPFGRGFWGAEISGDNGVGGSVELRFDQVLKSDFLKGYQLYAYVDRTDAWNFHSGGSALSLTLTGAGVRLYLPYDLQLGIEGAVPLDYRIPFDQPHDPRAFFSISKTFKFCPGSQQMRCS